MNAQSPEQLLATIEGLEARIAALETGKAGGVLDSKTLRFWLMLLGIAFAVIVFATVMAKFFNVQVPFVSDFFQLVGLGGGAGTARNITADHVMPAVQTWKTAQAQPPPQSTPNF